MINLEIKNKENPEEDFERIARNLINDSVLVVGDSEYQFTTLEFYYKNENVHNDIYTHGRDQQKELGKWYVHESGLDMTFGDKVNHGGILIRGLKKGDKYFNGPLICLWEIFAQFGDINSSKEFRFYVKELTDENISTRDHYSKIYKSRRAGLGENAKDENNFFRNKQYRFFIDPKLTQTDKGFIADDLWPQMEGSTENEKKQMVNDHFFGYKHFKFGPTIEKS